MATLSIPESATSAILNTSSNTPLPRHLGFDLLRVLATYMVIQIHSGEFYYIGSGGTVLSTPDAHWVGWFNSLLRASVPLFVMLSGFYLFPVKDDTEFFRKRFNRVLTPSWCGARCTPSTSTSAGSGR